LYVCQADDLPNRRELREAFSNQIEHDKKYAKFNRK